MEKKTKKKRYAIEVKKGWCKGCAICVEFCPEGVLAMEGNKVSVVDLDACRGCALCELMCPDFAIVVTEDSGK
jgi:2-oxoglutarate ferredoxin oxidoreductase subunit delta